MEGHPRTLFHDKHAKNVNIKEGEQVLLRKNIRNNTVLVKNIRTNKETKVNIKRRFEWIYPISNLENHDSKISIEEEHGETQNIKNVISIENLPRIKPYLLRDRSQMKKPRYVYGDSSMLKEE
ncbi:hypothetical protein RF11_09450 [Thelohanellus kitauei]|uniref:Uncharacterized protein n=1 Tax=Thelohanellus kitauei TaxID=669202 RepID=A0A0C2JHN0_THEKT|nr:hypothetical protein RF11_09450 [Thelohanellus kitauei]